MTDQPLRLLVFGAHPDDCEFTAAGLAALYAQRGHHVMFVSLTNGDSGHHVIGGAALARRRREEAAASAQVIGITSHILDNHDGELLPTLDHRREIIGLIRSFRPDLVLTPRPWDYHPDHRYTAQLVQDAAYMVTVPNVLAFHEHLARNPVIAYVSDTFLRPYPFMPDVVVPIDSVVEQKVDMLDRHVSQVYEWLPYNGGYDHEVPDDPRARRAWLRQHMDERMRRDADRYRDMLIAELGAAAGQKVQYAEAFEVSEYGAPLTDDARARLFPFF